MLNVHLAQFLKHLTMEGPRLCGFGVDLRRQAVMQEEC